MVKNFVGKNYYIQDSYDEEEVGVLKYKAFGESR
jgi:hypothetical protein